jgi:hypothetical protein
MRGTAACLVGLAVLCGLWIGGIAGTSAPAETISLRLQAIRVADDDGGRPAAIDAELFGEWVSFANLAFASTGVVFSYDPAADFAEIRNTLLNNIADPNDTFPDWRAQGALGNEIAAQYPGKILVVIRHGPGPVSTYGGSGDPAHGFVILPGLEGWISCGDLAYRALPHELGHYLGLGHTLAREFASLADAEDYFVSHGDDPSIFDGDGFSDTLPDPNIFSLDCASEVTEITLDGVQFVLPRDNLMSYYSEGTVLTPMQASVVRFMASLLARSDSAYPTNVDAASPPAGTVRFEAEDLSYSHSGPQPGRQDMSGFTPYPFSPRWSRDAQLYWGAGSRHSLTLYDLYAPETRLYSVLAYATLSPYFDIVSVQVDGKDVGSTIDAYAPNVRPSGPIEVCNVLELAKGWHRVTFTVIGTNGASLGHGFGVDCLEFRPWVNARSGG